MKKVRIGCGAGCSRDRIEPSEDMLKYGNVDYLVFETLSESSFSANQLHKYHNPDEGYNEMLEERMRRILPLAYEKRTKIITNMGSANPIAAFEKVANIACELGLKGLTIAMIEGDDILDKINHLNQLEGIRNNSILADDVNDKIIYANVYLGANPILEALEQGADVIITGRVADPSLFVGPLMYEFGWHQDDLTEMGQATLLGHLLECCGQVTGGYYAHPGYKEVNNLAHLGHPIAEISETGEFIITKLEGTGGEVSLGTCKEQLLYEIGDPSCYITPDAIIDLTGVCLKQLEKDIVQVYGAVSVGIPETLKVNVGYHDGYLFNGEVCFAGADSLQLAQLCGEIIRERMEIIGVSPIALRMDFVGYNSLCLSTVSNHYAPEKLSEVRLRVAVHLAAEEDAILLSREMGFLYTNGPAGSSGVRTDFKKKIKITPLFIPANEIRTQVLYKTV